MTEHAHEICFVSKDAGAGSPNILASVFFDDDDVEDPPISLAEANANAALIAASPELLAFAKWVIGQLQGDSGTGDSYWEQFPEYLAGRTAIEKAEAQP